MPFVGNAAASGSEQVSNAQTTRTQRLITAGGIDSFATTRTLDVTAMSRATVVVTQTTGVPGQFQLGVKTQGNTPNTWFPAQPIGALNMPVAVPIPISARAAIVRVEGRYATPGPHTFDVSVQVAAAT